MIGICHPSTCSRELQPKEIDDISNCASHSQSNWAGASVVPLARDILARSVQIESKTRRSEQDTSEDSPDCLILIYPSDSLSATLPFSLLAAVVIFSKMNPQMQDGYR